VNLGRSHLQGAAKKQPSHPLESRIYTRAWKIIIIETRRAGRRSKLASLPKDRNNGLREI